MFDCMNKYITFDKLLIVVAIAFFFCMNQYNGILVDAVLYTLQAVHFVHPERFVGDISFMYGNQDSFTIFSPLYVACINLFGVSNAALLLCFLSQLLFAVSFSYMLYAWFDKFHCKKIFFPSIILFFILYRFGELRSAVYQFNIVEPYVVPRTFSVAFALLGIGLFYTSKIKALIFILIGMSFNPLMAGWALPMWLFFYYPKYIFLVVVGSALFPLTFFLGVGSFNQFDSKWLLSCTTATDLYFDHFATFGLFYLWGTFVFKKNVSLEKIFRTLLFVWGIAFYWFVVATETKHIFLNQAQIFRMEWFCATTTFLLMVAVLYRHWILKFRKKTTLLPQDYLLWAFPILFWVDSILVDCCLIYAFLWKKEFRAKNIEKFYFAIRILIITSLFFTVFLELFRVANINLFDEYQSKDYVRSLGLLGVLAVGGLYLKKIYSKRKAFALLILFAAAIFSFAPLRFEEKSIAEVIVLAALTLVWIHPIHLAKKIHVIVPLLWLVPYAAAHYDTRTPEQIYSEKQTEMFWNESLFPVVVDRGNFLIMTGGFYSILPRLHFLTGSYVDYQSFSGGLLFRNQFIEVMHRISMLFFEQDNLPSQYEYHNFLRDEVPELWESLYNSDSLKKKFSFLCSHNEISYLATDLDMGEQKPIDSYTFPAEVGKINLYQCP